MVKLEPVALVDMSTMSQSELHSLSLRSESSLDLRHTDDLVNPEIDRSIFNESTESHQQTYSAASRHSSSTAIGRRSNPSRGTALASVDDDQEIAEDKSIVNYLKELTKSKKIKKSSANKLIKKSSAKKLLQPPPPEVLVSGDSEAGPEPKNEEMQDMQVVIYSDERKKDREERKLKEKVPENRDEIQLEIVNKNGVPIDLKALEIADDLYGAELGRRTAGLKTKEEVLGFMRNLEGQWGSTRKKKKIVDAGEFGDALPVGWKLLLRVKKSKGRPFLHCRSYISPNGQKFDSCKEVSSYLRRHFNDATQPVNQTGTNNQKVHGVASDNHVGSVGKNDDVNEDFVPNSTIPSSSMPNVQEEEVGLLMDIDNLPEVQVRDLFECYICNINFDKKNSYLNHLMLHHPATTMRYRKGSSIVEGAIVKDGQFECQICHRVFKERQSYKGHVEAHIRNNARTYGELPGQATVEKSTKSASREGLPPRPPRISKINASTEIARSSIPEISTAEPNDKGKNRSSPEAVEVVPIPESNATNSGDKLSYGSDSNEPKKKRCRTKSAKSASRDGLPPRPPSISKMDASAEIAQSSIPEISTAVPNDKAKNRSSPKAVEVVPIPETHATNSGNKLSLGSDSNEPKKEKCRTKSKTDSPRHKKIDEEKGNNDHHSHVKGSMEGLATSESEAAGVNIAGRHQFKTVCVWCMKEFNYVVVDPESQSESVGFMCTACKSKISGQLNKLDRYLSKNSDL